MKRALCLLILLSASAPAIAQDLSSAVETINRFAATNQQLPRERIYIHTDRDWYSLQDRIWFSAYVTEGGRNFLSDISNVLYVELVNPGGEIVTRELIELTEGRGKGSIALSELIEKDGIYQINAYTRWALNFGDSYRFSKKVAVHGEKEWHPEESDTDRFDLQFFPEGGHLVAGLNTNLAFKAVSPDGYGTNLEGRIIDQNGGQILDFRTDHLGMGSMEFMPEEGAQYHAVVNNQQVELPQVLLEGVVMNIRQNDDFIMADVKASPEFRDSTFILVAHVRGAIYFASQVSASSDGYAALIRKTEAPTGILHFTLLDSQGSPMAERIAFNKNPNDSLNPTLSIDDAASSFRQQVTADIQVSDINNNPVTGTASLSVFDDSVYPYAAHNADIITSLLLESELRGHIEQPGFYFSSHENADKYLDLLMMTQGWRAYDIQDRISEEKIAGFHPAEKGISVTGTIKTLIRQRPIENAIAYISMNATEEDVEKNELPAIQSTDQSGSFIINDLNFSGGRIISAKGNDEDGSDRIQVVLDDQFTDLPASYSTVPQSISMPPSFEGGEAGIENETVAERSMMNRVTTEQFVNYQMRGELDEIVVTDEGMGRDWIGTYFEDPSGATARVEPNKSEALRDLNIEQLLNQLPGVSYNFAQGELSIREGRYRPLIFVDGVEVDIETLTSMITADIESITVARSTVDLAIFGSDGAGGAIIVETFSGGGVQERVRGFDTKWFQGYQSPTSFYSPRYGVTVPRDLAVEDQRITLHWEPQIDVSERTARISFWTNDVPSTYRIVVEGITETGIPFYHTDTFIVQP